MPVSTGTRLGLRYPWELPTAWPELHGGKLKLTTMLIVVLILALFGALPTWGHSRSWGYGPSGGVGLVLLVLIVLFMTGRI